MRSVYCCQSDLIGLRSQIEVNRKPPIHFYNSPVGAGLPVRLGGVKSLETRVHTGHLRRR